MTFCETFKKVGKDVFGRTTVEELKEDTVYLVNTSSLCPRGLRNTWRHPGGECFDEILLL